MCCRFQKTMQFPANAINADESQNDGKLGSVEKFVWIK